VSLPAIQCLLNHFRVVADKDKEEKPQYVIDGKQIDPEDVKEVRWILNSCIFLSFSNGVEYLRNSS
jgi:hypothetical protein